jgi:hypothetical protein
VCSFIGVGWRRSTVVAVFLGHGKAGGCQRTKGKFAATSGQGIATADPSSVMCDSRHLLNQMGNQGMTRDRRVHETEKSGLCCLAAISSLDAMTCVARFDWSPSDISSHFAKSLLRLHLSICTSLLVRSMSFMLRKSVSLAGMRKLGPCDV